MGFLRNNIQLEEYFDSLYVDWKYISDADYKHIYSELNNFIDSDNYNLLIGDDAFLELEKRLPFSGYVFSAPRTKHLFSIYSNGGSNTAFGYIVSNLNKLDRSILNNIECVFSNSELTYACSLNHEWQGHCPETFIEKIA